jgi:hypothetical protein
MLFCYGVDGDFICPIKSDCYRHTQPMPGRDRLTRLPFDFVANACAMFVSNVPSEEFVRQSAYFLWLAAGRPEGRDVAFWTQATKQAEASMGRQAATDS